MEIESLRRFYRRSRYPTRAVDDVSFPHIAAGEIFGHCRYQRRRKKQSPLRTLNALTRPSRGRQRQRRGNFGAGRKSVTPVRQRIGMIFQHFNLMHTRQWRKKRRVYLKAAGWERSKNAPRVAEI